MPKSKTLLVTWGAAERPCPMERVSAHTIDRVATEAARAANPDAPPVFRTMIYGTPREVPNSLYYRRRLAAGDLQLAPKRSTRKKSETEG